LALTKVTEGIRTLGTGEVAIGNISGSAAGAAGTFLKQDGTWSAVASGIEWQAVQTTGFTAVAGKGYPCNTTAGTIAVTLPAGSVGDEIAILDYAGTAATNGISIVANGTEKIKGIASSTFHMGSDRIAVRLIYIDATQGWITSVDANAGSQAMGQTASVEYLVVGGGGGGGTGTGSPGYGRGGGGAGGYRTNFGGVAITFASAATYTATIGSGSGGSTNGLDSSLEGLNITTITSTGGGSGTNAAGTAGGSGGGGAEAAAGGAGNTPSTSPAQGYAGGSAAGMSQAGGGGGASEVGESVTSGTGGGVGGDGTSNAITGASVTYAGGGGGGSSGSAPAGGAGGGGAGYAHVGPVAPVAGTDGLGGGGGGGSYSTSSYPNGADGGDGVVILRMLTSVYSGTLTGEPTVTPDGLYTVIKFTGTGTYTQ
jgi:hypothetical protein